MSTTMVILLTSCMLAPIALITFFIRNEWVYRKRKTWVSKVAKYGKSMPVGSIQEFKDLLDAPEEYGKILWTFWCWDFKKFVKPDAWRRVMGDKQWKK